MREIRAYGSVGAPEGNLRRYPAVPWRYQREGLMSVVKGKGRAAEAFPTARGRRS